MEVKELKKGETLTIRLKGLATAGYNWGYTVGNPKLIAVTMAYDRPEGTMSVKMGQSADELFTITGLHTGKTTIHFKQVRSWDDKEGQANEKKIKIVITE